MPRKPKRVIVEQVELDEVLDNPPWERVVMFFKDHDCDEHWLITVIEKHLQTEEQRLALFNHRFSIADMLNGRVAGEENHKLVEEIWQNWNEKLGFHCFGY